MATHSNKTCPRCDTALTGSEPDCPQCHLPFVGVSKLAGAPGTQPNCPLCRLPLYPAVLAGLPVLHCAECKGTALKRETLMKLAPQGSKDVVIGAEELNYKRPAFFEPREKPPILVCPFCRKRMKAVPFGKAKPDLCVDCSALWFDGPAPSDLNEALGPYKWKAAKGTGPSRSQSRRERMAEED
jgi:Zn-finger nucleic acid-binding protein